MTITFNEIKYQNKNMKKTKYVLEKKNQNIINWRITEIILFQVKLQEAKLQKTQFEIRKK